MKNKWIVVSVFSALCIVVSCSKKDSSDDSTTPPLPPPGPVMDSSKCLLTDVKYEWLANAPYNVDPFTLTYDSLNRITRRKTTYGFLLYSYEPAKVTMRSYINSVADSNLAGRYMYTLDNNGRIVSHTEAFYSKPISESNYTRQDRVDYEYNAEGYLINLKSYTNGTSISEENKFTYQNGNLVQREHIYYSWSGSGVKDGADTLTYTYDNTPWYPEATYLYEINDYRPFKTDKPNKNNVTSIQCKMYDRTGGNLNMYKSIQYVYSAKGPRLEKVTMSATTTKGALNTTIGFGFKCD